MKRRRFSLSVHESTDDIRSGRDDSGVAGRDSPQPRRALRPSTAWGVAGRRGTELPGSGGSIGGFTWNGGKLGSPLREGGFCRAERASGPWPAGATGSGRDETGGGGPEEKSGRLWIAGPALGRPFVVPLFGKTIGGDPACAPMPTLVPTLRLSCA